MTFYILRRTRLQRRWTLRNLLSVKYEGSLCSTCRSASHLATDSSNLMIQKTRNIGIIAHIDAGKTTTTERMLYYSGYTRRIGDVDDGSTVTDFLPAERARGITIQSAAVTFHWPPSSESRAEASPNTLSLSQVSHTINLIDTPGHADFTFEVLRSLRILDGAVCILDGVAGVEAQTEKVWLQANKYQIPRIIFVNKLDRDGAAFGKAVREVGSRLRGLPAVCQIPLWQGGKGDFTGVVDVVNLCGLLWERGGDGKKIQRLSLKELLLVDPGLESEVKKARAALIDALCEFDEQILNTWLELNDDSMAIPPQDIKDSLRRCILDGSGRLIPVFAGASFRNIGIQPLLDAINDLLPNPTERPGPEISLGGVKGSLTDLLDGKIQAESQTNGQLTKRSHTPTSLVANIEGCALAFKVVNDSQRGVLVYVRVYSGSIKRNAALWNTNLHVTERAQRLLRMYASDAEEISTIPMGQIGVIAGLKHARTGDTLISYPGVNPKTGPSGALNSLQLRPIEIPPPVFFAAVEASSLSEEKNVAEILRLMLREDPSLHVSIDEESGQMLLSGMGELHLEIARDRLVTDYKAKATMGKVEIGYRETVLAQTSTYDVIFDREVAGKRGKAGCTASIEPLADLLVDEHVIERDGNAISIKLETASSQDPEELLNLPPHLPFEVLSSALVNGVVAALGRGPRRGFPIHSNHVTLTFSTLKHLFGTDTTPAALASAARLAVQGALKDAFASQYVGLMEPVMNVIISCDESSLGAIVHDLSSARGGQVMSLGDENDTVNSGIELEPIDAERIYVPPDRFESAGSNAIELNGPGQQRHISARVPLKEMVGYLKHLRSLTGGRGTFVMAIDRFERLSGPREKAV